MFNFSSVNTAEVNASSQLPAAPVLSIVATEDINALSWNSPTFTDFFIIYWSDKPFTSSDEPGVHTIARDDLHAVPTPADDLVTDVSYSHAIPAVFSLKVLYYRVAAFNSNGETLSNQVDSYNFRIAIYEDLYDATLEELTLKFTPELRLQYQDSILWKSFVESLCSELAQGRFEIKEALKQLNLQKAVDVFLNLWNNITGISRMNLTDVDTGLPVPETDAQYRQRLVDSIFWDKVSNVALKKTMLLKLGYDADIIDVGMNADNFRNVPEAATSGRTVSYGGAFRPGETIWFLNVGPNASATCVSDDGTTLVFTNYYAPPGFPTGTPGSGDGAVPYSLWSYDSFAFCAPTAAALGGQITHGLISCAFASLIPTVLVGAPITFFGSGAQGIVISFIGGTLTFQQVGALLPVQYDIVKVPIVSLGGTIEPVAVLTSSVFTLTSTSTSIHSKILANIYSVNLGAKQLDDAALNVIYDEISPLAALGNVLTKILQDVSSAFEDWNATFGNIPYGPIFMGAPSYGGAAKTTAGDNWAVGEELCLDNQWDMDDGKIFYGNDGPDDIVMLTRTS